MRTVQELARALSVEVEVDVDALVAGARRRAARRRRRQVVGAGLAIVAVAAAVAGPGMLTGGPAPAGSPPTVITGMCTPEALPSPVDDGVQRSIPVVDMDPTGRYLVGSMIVNVVGSGDVGIAQAVVVRWEDGTPTTIGGPGFNTYAMGVNARGWVVGYGERELPPTRPYVLTPDDGLLRFAWIYDGEKINELPPPAGYENAFAMAVNDGGEIAGWAGGRDMGARVAVVWTAGADGQYAPRRLAGWPEAAALGIADDGTIVGEVGHRPHVWAPDGSDHDLPLPAGVEDGVVVNERISGDWAIGVLLSEAVVRWNLRTDDLSTVDLSAAPGGISVAVNERGDFAYASGHGPILVRDGISYALPDRADLGPGRLSTQFAGVSADGTMVAGGQSPVDSAGAIVQPTLWRC